MNNNDKFLKQRNRRHWFMKVVMSLLNKWYIYGGDDPDGFDCSGIVIEGLRAVGVIHSKKDMTAAGMFKKWSHLSVPIPFEGCLAFWIGLDKVVYHVAVCLDDQYCLTADGGGSKTKTEEDAKRDDAYIKIRPIDHRSWH